MMAELERRKLLGQHAGRLPERQRRAVPEGEGHAVRRRDPDAARPGLARRDPRRHGVRPRPGEHGRPGAHAARAGRRHAARATCRAGASARCSRGPTRSPATSTSSASATGTTATSTSARCATIALQADPHRRLHRASALHRRRHRREPVVPGAPRPGQARPAHAGAAAAVRGAARAARAVRPANGSVGGHRTWPTTRPTRRGARARGRAAGLDRAHRRFSGGLPGAGRQHRPDHRRAVHHQDPAAPERRLPPPAERWGTPGPT